MGIEDFNNAYNSTKVYSIFEQSGSNNKTRPYNNKYHNCKFDFIPIITLANMLLLANSTDNNFDNLCTFYIANKQTCVVI